MVFSVVFVEKQVRGQSPHSGISDLMAANSAFNTKSQNYLEDRVKIFFAFIHDIKSPELEKNLFS